MEAGIIGLGKFGMQLGQSLTELGHTCVGIDSDSCKVQQAREFLGQVYEADATDINTLAELKLHTLDIVAVTIGSHLEEALLAILGLQELGARHIIVKASDPMHKKVLERMGVGTIVQPEIDAARRMAFKLDNPGFLDLLPIGRGVFIQEAKVENWAGKSLRELNVRRKSNILVAAVREKDKDRYRFVPDPDHVLQQGDGLLIIGYGDDMQKVVGRT